LLFGYGAGVFGYDYNGSIGVVGRKDDPLTEYSNTERKNQ
jgi:hypothetical protein